MPAITPLQSSFSGGELSPRMYRRMDSRIFEQGARTMRNFIASSKGPAKSRPGFRYVGGVQPLQGVAVIVQTETLTITTPDVDVQLI